MAQYLGNHRSSPMNTNLRIFNCLNAALRHADVEVCVLFADAVIVDGRSLNWGTFATNPRLVRKAEKQLIELGKGRGHCTWNRTGRRR